MSSEWGAPQSSDYRNPPTEGFDKLLARLNDAIRQAQEMRNNLLKTAGLTVTPEGLIVDSSLTVNGDLDSTGAASFDGDMTVGGEMTVTGDAVFSGNLAVPNGSITNDALSNPLTAGVAAPDWQNNWSATNSWVTKASTTITVPAGFTEALVFAASSVTAVGSVIRFDVRSVIGGGAGAAGPEMQNLVNGVAATSVPHSRTLTGLAGGTITIAAQVWSTPNLAAHTGNIASITGFAIFFR